MRTGGWFLSAMKRDERGASVIEYAVLVALIAIACRASLEAVGAGVNVAFSTVAALLGYQPPLM